jgi:hypothetical protein
MPWLLMKSASHARAVLSVFFSIFSSYLLTLATLFGCPHMEAFAQGSSFTLAPPVRDATAIATLQGALSAMGGFSGWSQLHGATVSGTYIQDREQTNLPLTWSDDWSGEARMRRDNSSTNGGPRGIYLQDVPAQSPSQPPDWSATSGRATHKPRFDSVAALIVHLPGAAIFVALQNPAYAITTTVLPPTTTSDGPCVRIQRTRTGGRDSSVDVSICFSKTSSLPKVPM